jgi:hypothetical protein
MTQKYASFITEQQNHNSLRTIKEAKEQYTHEIDVHPAGWDNVSSQKHKEGTDKMVEKLKRKGFNAKVHEYHGPSGGAATIHIGHPDGPGPIDKFIKRSYDPDHKAGDPTYNI